MEGFPWQYKIRARQENLSASDHREVLTVLGYVDKLYKTQYLAPEQGIRNSKKIPINKSQYSKLYK